MRVSSERDGAQYRPENLKKELAGPDVTDIQYLFKKGGVYLTANVLLVRFFFSLSFFCYFYRALYRLLFTSLNMLIV